MGKKLKGRTKTTKKQIGGLFPTKLCTQGVFLQYVKPLACNLDKLPPPTTVFYLPFSNRCY